MSKKKPQDDVVVLRQKFEEVNKVILAVERWIDKIWCNVFTWYSIWEPGSSDQFLRAFKVDLADALRERYTSSLVDDDVQACKSELGKSYDVDISNQTDRYCQAFKAVDNFKNDDAQLADALLDLGVATITLLDFGVVPARKLRGNLIADLNLAQPVTPRRKKRGRPRDPEIAKRDQRMLEAWGTDRYAKYSELGNSFGVSGDVVRKALQRAKRRRVR